MLQNTTYNENNSHFYQWTKAEPVHKEQDTFIYNAEQYIGSYLPTIGQERESMFQKHTLAVTSSDYHPHKEPQPPMLLFPILVLFAIFLALFYHNHKLSFSTAAMAIVNPKKMQDGVIDSLIGRIVSLVPIAFLLSAALGIMVYYQFFPHESWYIFIALILAPALLYLFRNGVMRLIGVVFEQQSLVSDYIVGNYFIHLLLITLLFPLLFVYFYMPSLSMGILIAMAVLMTLVYLARLTRWVIMFFTQVRGRSFHLFYYLCSVEIVPLLVAIKLIISQ